MIGNTTDPFLPLRDDIAMTHQLGNARLLVVRGYGHTAFLNPSTCASTYMTTYFQTGALPPKGTACHQNLPPFPPPSGCGYGGAVVQSARGGGRGVAARHPMQPKDPLPEPAKI